MSLRTKINKQSVLLSNEKEKSNRLQKELLELKRELSLKKEENQKLIKANSKLDKVLAESQRKKSELEEAAEYVSYFKHYSFVCKSCHQINIREIFNDRYEYKFKCGYCGDVNFAAFNFEYIYILTSEHSKLIRVEYSDRNPAYDLVDINSQYDAIPWRLEAYHKTFSGVRLRKIIYRTLKKFRVNQKELFDISLEEVRQILLFMYGLKLIAVDPNKIPMG